MNNGFLDKVSDFVAYGTITTAFLIVVLLFMLCCLSCLRWWWSRSWSDSPSVLRQDHGGGASVQVLQVVIQREGVDATAAPAVTTFSQTNGGAAADCCAVCLGEYTAGVAVRQLPACRHVFHRTCIDLWLRKHSTCPICRHSTLPAPPVAAARLPPGARRLFL